MATTAVIPATINSGNTPGGPWLEVTIDEASIPASWNIGYDHAAQSGNVALNVTVPAFTAAGVSTTETITVFAKDVVREETPNDGDLQEVDNGATVTVTLALSRPIYASDTINSITFAAGWYTGAAGETISSGITNNSTRTYPKPMCRPLLPPYENLTGPVDIEIGADHLYGIACVRMVMETTGSVEIDSVTVTEETLSALAAVGDGSNVPVVPGHIGTLDRGALTVGDVRVQVFVYPNQGDVIFDSRSVADGFDEVSERMGPLRFRANDAPTYFAVDGVGGSPASASDEATARLTPYATIDAAISAGAGQSDIIVLESGAHVNGTINAGNADGYAALTIRNATGVTDAVWQGSTNDPMTGIIRAKGVAGGLSFSSSAVGCLRGGGNSAGSAIIFEGLSSLQATNGTASVYQNGAYWMVNCDDVRITRMDVFGSNRIAWALLRGSHFGTDETRHKSNYSVVACTGFLSVHDHDGAVSSRTDNVLIWNVVLTTGTTTRERGVDLGEQVDHGISIRNAVVLSASVNGAAAFYLWADGNAASIQHVLVDCPSAIDERINIFYNDADGVSTPRIDCAYRGALCDTSFNMKTDTFVDETHGAQAVRAGNWECRYAVNSFGTHESTELGGTFSPELEPDLTTGVLTFEADGFTPTAIAARTGPRPMKHDLFGNQRKPASFSPGAVELDPVVAGSGGGDAPRPFGFGFGLRAA